MKHEGEWFSTKSPIKPEYMEIVLCVNKQGGLWLDQYWPDENFDNPFFKNREVDFWMRIPKPPKLNSYYVEEDDL